MKSMSTPYSHLGVQYFPLGGINVTNMADYLALPSVPAVGGSWIVKKELVARNTPHCTLHIATQYATRNTPPPAPAFLTRSEGAW